MRNRVLSYGIPVLLVLMCIGTAQASAPTTVGVVIQGPDEGWVDEELLYWAYWRCEFDEQTLQEINDGEASTAITYEWSYGPATLVAGAADSQSIVIVYDYENGGAVHTVSVTFTVTVTYKDGSSDSASASDSKQVTVKRPELYSLELEWESVCAGGRPNAVHRTWITGEITDGFGGPAEGFAVTFSIDNEYAQYRYQQVPATLSYIQDVSDADGVVEALLTSPDQEGAVRVVVEVEWDADPVDCIVSVGLPYEFDWEPKDQIVLGLGDDADLTEVLRFDDSPVPGHTIAWDIFEVYDENGAYVANPGALYGYPPQDSVTDGYGAATSTYVTGPWCGYITIRATDTTCYDAAGVNVELGDFYIIVSRIDYLEVYDAYQTSASHYVNSIMPGASVIVYAVMKPPIGPDQAEGTMHWSGGEEGANCLERFVSRATSGSNFITAEFGQSSDSVTIKVCMITSISVVSGASEIDDDNAATAVDPDDTQGVILTANLFPVIATVPPQLLLWSGGAEGGQPESRKVTKNVPRSEYITCECGASSDDITVWVIDADLGIAGVADDDEDTTPGICYVNSDDDNNNSNDDRNDTSVSGENDLIPVALSITPKNVPEGVFSVSASSGLALWTSPTKGTAWSGSVNLASAPLPTQLWVEGLSVSDNPGDKSVSMEYTWSGAELEDDVLVTVLPRDGTSEAALKVFGGLDGSEPVGEINGTVGGTVYPVLYVTIGAGERCTTGSVTLRIADEYPGYWDGTEAYTDTSISLSSSSGWQVYNGSSWVGAQDGPSGTDNKEGATPLQYRYIVTGGWLTHKTPFGNNGPHSVSTTSQIEFEEWVVGDGWTNEYPCGPAATSVTTENLWISSCTASNGTIDYFKYDPDGGPELAHPHLQFTISDADPHKYCCIIRFRETIGEGTWNWDSGWSSMRYEPQDATALTMDIDLTVPDGEGHCLNENDHKWGTYTYDFLVLEYTGASPVWIQDDAHDWNFLKRYREGYYLWVPKDLPSPYGDKPGHSVWTETPEDGSTQFRGYYCLESEWATAEEAQVPRGDDVCIVVVDSELNERGSKTGPSVPETLGANYGTVDSDQDDELDGLLLYTFGGSYPEGTWRGIFTAADNGGLRSPEWRSHTPLRMITANAEARSPRYVEYITGSYAGTDWYGAWIRPDATKTWTVYLDPKAYVNTFVKTEFDKHDGMTRTVAGTNGGFFTGSAPIGYVGVGPAQWVGNPNAVRRWGFGLTDDSWTHAPSTCVRQDAPMPGDPDKYYRHSDVHAHRAGLSCVGCLIEGFQQLGSESSGDTSAVHWTDKDARTCIAWTAPGDVFLIIGDDRTGEGWDWQNMCSFFTSALPAYMRDEFGYGSVVIWNAMALDGGTSTGFRYMYSDWRGEDTEYHNGTNSGRDVISGVLGMSRPR